jgi:hypothetical protein
MAFRSRRLRSAQGFPHDNLAAPINAVNLKNAFGQIEADRANLHFGWLPARGRSDSNHTLAPRCRERKPSTPSALGRKRTLVRWLSHKLCYQSDISSCAVALADRPPCLKNMDAARRGWATARECSFGYLLMTRPAPSPTAERTDAFPPFAPDPAKRGLAPGRRGR